MAWVSQTLQGPRAGPEEELSRSPLDCYYSGILAPVGQDIAPAQAETLQDLPGGLEDADATLEPEGEADETSAGGRADYLPSSSVGISFLATPDIELEVIVRAGRYEYDRGSRTEGQDQSARWRRRQLGTAPGELRFRPPESPRTDFRRTLAGKAEVNVRWRQYNGNWLVTVALVNRSEMGGGPHFAEELAKACFFQTELVCAPIKGRLLPYPRLACARLSEEEEELELQYRDKQILAIGHGVAVNWEAAKDGDVREIRASFLPAVEVPLVTTQNTDLPEQSLDIEFLAKCDKQPDAVIGQLQLFVDRYAEWVGKQEQRYLAAAKDSEKVVARIAARQKQAVERMRRGCRLLQDNDRVRRAFSMAQEAMRQQMTRVRQLQTKPGARAATPFRWRPFQLAFILLALESVLDPESSARDCVDLLWFPTGGGKTEAYLALIAMLVLYRRLRWTGSSGGTAVIMRYTLRLLTAQQFQRATALICALEQMRRQAPKELGHEPITGGLWVGGASTPNSNQEALQILAEMQNGHRGSRGLFLDQCPWCGTALVSHGVEVAEPGAPGIRAVSGGIEFFCPKPDCPFHPQLPLHVVDEHLYNHPPTLLLATVDKFARLTWEERASAFLGQNGNRPPELIIQDELHLIAGPLGSFAGLYEAALDAILAFKDIKPKYIASTATIRHARQQVQSLYGREMMIFPPPGHSCDDSFFARTDRQRAGRLYVGLCGDNPLRDWRETLAGAAAAALFAPGAMEWTDDLRDAWWTLVIYHGSLRGVGLSHLLAQFRIPEELNQLQIEDASQKHNGVANVKPMPGWAPTDRALFEGQVLELTSRVDAAGVQNVLRRLQKPCSDPEAISLVLCTNLVFGLF